MATTDDNTATVHSSGGDALYVKPKFKKSSAGKFDGECHSCGRKGHKKVDCRQRQRESGRDSKVEPKGKKKDEALSVFIAESAATTRIVADSGASRHLTGKQALVPISY